MNVGPTPGDETEDVKKWSQDNKDHPFMVHLRSSAVSLLSGHGLVSKLNVDCQPSTNPMFPFSGS